MNPEETQTRFEPVHVDGRKLPRLLLRTPARLAAPSGERLTCVVRDVSPDGLQLRCNRVTAAKINPSGRAIRDDDARIHVEVTFGVPTDDGKVVVTLLGRLSYFSIIAPDVVAIGLALVGASKPDRDRLQRFFMHALRPRDEPTGDAAEPPRIGQQIKGRGDRLVLEPHGTSDG